MTQNWVLLGSVRYDLAIGQFDQTRFGVGYTDDCCCVAKLYHLLHLYRRTPTPNNTFMLQMSLRTLGPDALAPILPNSKFPREV